MIITHAIQAKLVENKNTSPLLMRNILKEELQNFVLNFVYNSDYKDLIFTGGTCLRKNYGLNRLSEDLDFDFVGEFNIDEFVKGIKKYFKSSLKYDDLSVKIAPNNRSLFLKFPVLKKLDNIGMMGEGGTPLDLFLRCDFSEEKIGLYETEVNSIQAGNFEFFTLSYDLPTLFSNKIVAFIERVFYKGKFQKVPFKGRDVYDLYWFFQLSSKTGFSLKPNLPRLYKLLGVESLGEVRELLKAKIEQVEEEYVYKDLYPLVENGKFLEQFRDNFKANISSKMELVLV